jgi:hypothetical protein
MGKRDVNMLSGSITKGLFAISIPVMVMNVVQSMFSILDMTILKTYDTDGMAVGAVGACGSLILLITGLVIGISAGANVIIGHGPHELQGIELYKEGLILYSVGNFIFQTETVEFQPWDAYANRNMPLDTKVGAYMDDRSCNGTKGYCVQWPIWNAVLPAWTMEDGKITEVKLYPIELGMDKPRSQKGVPVLNGSHETLEYLQKISTCYGTKIDIADGVGTIRL